MGGDLAYGKSVTTYLKFVAVNVKKLEVACRVQIWNENFFENSEKFCYRLFWIQFQWIFSS